MSSSECGRSTHLAGKSRLPLVISIVAIAIVTAVVSLSWLNQRNVSGWKRYQAEIAARGESLDWKDYLPPPLPPDAENFGATPLLQSIGRKGKVDPMAWGRINGTGLSDQLGKTGDWTTGQRAELKSIQDSLRGAGFTLPPLPQEPAADVLAVLDGLKPEIDELHEASKRAFAKLKLTYPDPISADIPNFAALRRLSELLSLRASAELSLGSTDEAFADVRVIHRLADVNRAEPFLVSAMIYCALHNLALQTFWEGWVSGQWSDEQLKEFQSRFASVDMLAALDKAMRGERAAVDSLVETLNGKQLAQSIAPTGAASGGSWKHKLEHFSVRFSSRDLRNRNLLYYYRLLDQTLFNSYDLRRHRIFPGKCDAAVVLLGRSLNRTTAENYLASRALPNFLRALQTVARNQNFVSEALIVCALERYRRANGEYPATLTQLSPGFLENLPHDIITDEDLKYRRTADGQFLLYSVGWNERDDNGKAEKDKGDWVWPVAVER